MRISLVVDSLFMGDLVESREDEKREEEEEVEEQFVENFIESAEKIRSNRPKERNTLAILTRLTNPHLHIAGFNDNLVFTLFAFKGIDERDI